MTLDEFMIEFLALLSQLSSAAPREDLDPVEEVPHFFLTRSVLFPIFFLS